MVVVEPGTTADVDAVVDLWVDLAADQRAYDSHLLASDNRGPIRETIVRSAVTDELLVARDADEQRSSNSTTPSDAADDLAGFVTFGVESGSYRQDVTRGVVQNIYVVPDRRGEGIGSELLDEAERRLAAAGVDIVSLEVMAANDAARRFYRRHGYAPHRVELEKSVESDTLTKE